MYLEKKSKVSKNTLVPTYANILPTYAHPTSRTVKSNTPHNPKLLILLQVSIAWFFSSGSPYHDTNLFTES